LSLNTRKYFESLHSANNSCTITPRDSTHDQVRA
jgi:hypothetical protein